MTERLAALQRAAHNAAEQALRLPVSFWRTLLFWLFAASVLFFPFGQIFRTLPPALCLVPLAFLYTRDWQNCNLRHLSVWWLWLLFFVGIGVMILSSSWPGASWHGVRPNLFRGFLLPFIALECVRDEKDLRRLTILFAATAVLEGLAGLWQFGTGADLFTGKAPMGYGSAPFEPGSLSSLREFRLTGTMSSYRVGNYLALLLLPATGLYFLWRGAQRTLHPALCALLTVLLLSPALFLLLGSQTRSAILALSCALYMVWILTSRPGLKALIPPLVGVAVLLFGPDRISWARMMADERVLIWIEGWKCFLVNPLTGSGADTFALACQALGVTHLPNGSLVPPHPHNVYLQWLIDGGVIGFAIMLVWAYGLLLWSGLRIVRGLYRPGVWDAAHQTYWRLVACFWAGWLVYLIECAAAHGFYRVWWVSTAFSILGVLLGACVQAQRVACAQE